MTLLKLFELEDTEQEHVVSTLSEGEHVLGRDLLKCDDKRVSRKHAVINVKEESVTIKSIHLNPCFFKAASGQCIEILQKENSIGLNDGDQFGLLADKFWFKVKVIVDENNGSRKESESDNSLSVPQNSSKRTHTDENDDQEETIKRQRVSESNDPTTSTSPKSKSPSLDGLLDSALNTTHNDEGNINANLLINNLQSIVEEDYGNRNSVKKENVSDDSDSDKSMDLLEPVKTERPDGSVPIKAEKIKPENDPQEGTNSNNDVKKEKVEETAEPVKVSDGSVQTDPSASTSDPAKKKTKRDRCWYGASCYRKNPIHRTDFSHPGDNDYDSDPDDDRPECPFGASCYRTNSDHRKQYKHKYQLAPKPKAVQPKKNNSPGVDSDSGGNDSSSSSEDGKDAGNGPRTKRKAALKKTKYAETPEDDYDFEDPFINDASSDEFKLSADDSGDTSTDWDDSQKVDEDSIETRRLLKEAKKFTKRKGKKRDK